MTAHTSESLNSCNKPDPENNYSYDETKQICPISGLNNYYQSDAYIFTKQYQVNMSERVEDSNLGTGSLTSRSGLIFALPHPVIYQKSSPYKISSEATIKSPPAEREKQANPKSKHILQKKQKKSKEKAHSTLELQKYGEDGQKQPKSVLKETLYRKFMDKGKIYNPFENMNNSEKDKEKETTHNSNVKLRQLNLVVLSKREEIKRSKKSKLEKSPEKEKEKEKQKPSDRTMPAIGNTSPLPHFARSRSSFYKSPTGQYSTLAFLSKTIFSQIATHFTTRIPKEKAIEPFELGISKVKIIDKNSSRAFKTKRRSQEHSDDERIGLIRINHGLLYVNHGSVQRKWKNHRQISTRKRTQLKGWEEQLPQYNILEEN